MHSSFRRNTEYSTHPWLYPVPLSHPASLSFRPHLAVGCRCTLSSFPSPVGSQLPELAHTCPSQVYLGFDDYAYGCPLHRCTPSPFPVPPSSLSTLLGQLDVAVPFPPFLLLWAPNSQSLTYLSNAAGPGPLTTRLAEVLVTAAKTPYKTKSEPSNLQ